MQEAIDWKTEEPKAMEDYELVEYLHFLAGQVEHGGPHTNGGRARLVKALTAAAWRVEDLTQEES